MYKITRCVPTSNYNGHKQISNTATIQLQFSSPSLPFFPNGPALPFYHKANV